MNYYTRLFRLEPVTLSSGLKSDWKIDCDAITPEDWQCLARMAREILPPFCVAHGVPRGGVQFALALNRYATGNAIHPLLVAEDVCTTGGSMERFRESLGTKVPEGGVIGVCVFARTPFYPKWVYPVFAYASKTYVKEDRDADPS